MSVRYDKCFGAAQPISEVSGPYEMSWSNIKTQMSREEVFVELTTISSRSKAFKVDWMW